MFWLLKTCIDPQITVGKLRPKVPVILHDNLQPESHKPLWPSYPSHIIAAATWPDEYWYVHIGLRAHDFTHPPDLWHQPILANVTSAWSWNLCGITSAIQLKSADLLKLRAWKTAADLRRGGGCRVRESTEEAITIAQRITCWNCRLILILVPHSNSFLGQTEPVPHKGDVKNAYRILVSALKVRDQFGNSPLYGAVILRFILNGV